MKINRLILLVFLLGTNLFAGGCSSVRVNGQTNAKTPNVENNANLSPNKTVEKPDNINAASTDNSSSAAKLSDDPIVFQEKLKTQNLTENEMAAAAKLLGWNDAKELCGAANSRIESQPPMPEKKIRTRFFDIGEDEYLVNLDCDGANNVFYSYSEKQNPPTARIMSFEYFEKDLETGKYTKFITYFPNGAAEFDVKTKELIVTANFTSTANCGYQTAYQFKNGKPILREIRANWDCENNFPANKRWAKENIQKVRSLTAEIVDEVKESKQ